MKKNTSFKELLTLPLETVLTDYVTMEIERARLVSTMHRTRLKDPVAAKDLAKKSVAHSNLIQAFALEAIKHPEIAIQLNELKSLRYSSIAQRGGFIGIHERLIKNEWLKEDVQAILVQLRGKAAEHSRNQSQERDRGGRSY